MFSDSMMLGGGRKAAFSIAHSVRLDGVADYFSRTPSAVGNRKTWTFSAWIKRSAIGTQQFLLIAGINSNESESVFFDANDKLNLWIAVSNIWGGRIQTNAVFRDTTSWGHLVISKDVTTATAKIYWNGTEQPTTVLTEFVNIEGYVNNTYQHRIGEGNAVIANGIFSGYITQPILVDGVALDPSAFGETDPVTGSWRPKRISNLDFGANGFHLDFADGADLGKDVSGKGNDWLPVSLGAADVMLDTPNNNFCTWDSLSSRNCTLSNGALTGKTPAAFSGHLRGTIGVSSGVWCWEVTPSEDTYVAMPGIVGESVSQEDNGNYANSACFYVGVGWVFKNSNNNTVIDPPGRDRNVIPITTTETLGFVLDCDNNTLKFYQSGVLQYTISEIPPDTYFPYCTDGGSVRNATVTANFGQQPLVYKSAYGEAKLLCTANLPKPVIQAPAKYMDVVTYSGNADSSGGIWSPIVTDVTTAPGPISYIVGQNGDYLYVYQANNAYGNQAAFTVWRKNADGTFTQTSSLSMPAGFSRGCVVLNTTQTGGSGFYGYISNGDTIGRVVTFTFSHTGGGSIVASDSIGYGTYPDGLLKLSNNLIAMNTGYSGGLHICFAIDANLAISKTNSVTGTLGVNNGWASEMHKLSATSYLVTYKSSSTTNVGVVSCSGNTLTVTSIAQVFNYLTMDTKIIKLDDGRFWIHDSTNDYSAVINVVENTVNVVVSQFQQNVFGSLTFGMSWAYCDYNSWKKVGTDHWLIPACHNNSGPNAQTMAILDLQIDAATGTATALWQSPLTAPLSSREAFWGSVYGDDVVASFNNDLYYYENAFNVGEWGADSRTQVVSGLDFQPDLVWIKSRNGAADHAVYDSLRGVRNRLETSNSDAEAGNDTGLTAFTGNGFSLGDLAQVNTSGTDYVAWCWKAGGAPVANAEGSVASQVSVNPTAGFSIVTAATLTSNVHTIGHGLGRAPAFVIWKMRNSANDWGVYHVGPGATKAALLNSSLAFSTSSAWDNTSPSASVLTVSGWGAGDYVAYCWAEVPGFSKFGGYTGNGLVDGPFVHCGFRPRWIMVKRVDNIGNWHVFDTTRDTYNPADKRLYANTQDAEVSKVTFDIDVTGFKLREPTGSNPNISGGTYIYAAFAEAPLGGAKTVPAKAR